MSITYPPYRGLRWEEDYAIEQLLTGITVPNAQGKALPVKVVWHDPLRELQQVTYPYFLLQFLDLTPRREEEVRGIVPFYYDGYTGNLLPNGEHTLGEFPIPVLLYYQCSVYSSNQQHDVILNDMCATTFFPIRYGQLNCASGTARRLDFVSLASNDVIDGNNRRIFCKTWTFVVDADIIPSQWPTPTQVTEAVVTLSDMDGNTPYDVDMSWAAVLSGQVASLTLSSIALEEVPLSEGAVLSISPLPQSSLGTSGATLSLSGQA